MVRRYELEDWEWEAIQPCLPKRKRMGRPPRDARQVLNGVFWILRAGAPWRDLPERYGAWETVYRRFREWQRQGVIECMLKRLQLRLNQEGHIDLDLWCIDGTSIRAARAAAGAPKKGAPDRKRPKRWGAPAADSGPSSTW